MWILLKQEWQQLGQMQVCTLLQTDNHTSTPPLSFLQSNIKYQCNITITIQYSEQNIDIE